ncbi:sensor histidine kinase [Streptomyces sp. NPDC052236]|uniref:sensor histidine kinase n=1 Tax=Streptomyces sp. NPDC052236 TaxID=3365686 RepID=UPI0037CFB32A
MPAIRRPSLLLKHVPPGVWMVLIWCAVTAYTLATSAWPGQPRWVWFLSATDGAGGGLPRWPQLAVAFVMVVCAGLPRRQPLTALALLLGGTIVSAITLSVKDIPLLQFLAVDIALCFIAATRPRRTSVTAAVMALGVLLGYAVARVLLGMPIEPSTVLIVILTTVMVWLIGNSIHQSHVHAEALRAQAAAQAVTAERLRIARELHDMVAHSIGIIAIQAGVGSRVIDTQPGEARNALRAIETTSRETLSGLRRMLGALRRSGPGGGMEGLMEGLADLERLTARTTDAGVRVDVEWRGERRPLPAEIDLSAFRIVQEAVTNVVRHAGAERCRVSIEQGDGELTIEVVDEGNGSPVAGTGPGYGIAGMRERVGLLHGQFTAGPRPEGGFRVAARLPVPAPVEVR